MRPDRWLQKWLRRLGLDVTRYGPEQSFGWCLARLLEGHGIDAVLDVGAAEGRYATSLRALGYESRIVSFEPLPGAHEALRRRARADERWTVAPRMALGDREGQVELGVTLRRSASSVLPAAESARVRSGDFERESEVTAPVSTLESQAEDYVDEGERIFVKIDVQGYENRVLDGAGEFASRVVGWQVEMSTRELYEGQVLYRELLDRFEKLGFELAHLAPVYVDGKTGRMLQFDAVLFR